ncbi:MAG: hypothetical protein M1838_006199 [Thelocarpon superellum]|nr:MAG: hypothetical protein M1838_006199 [Thelocarpon superellum]
MASSTPRVTIAKPPRNGASSGILPVPAASTQPGAHKGGTSRAAGPRLKVVIRRLPPGLTQAELEEALGTPWQEGQGKVDWMFYRPGKVSQDLAKASRPSRVYLHLTDPANLTALSDHVRQTPFHDAKSTWNSPSLLGPPSVEFAPYGRLPGNKRRQDARQGTIDQDPEFIAFLESLTNPPAPKPSLAEGGEEAIAKEDPVTMTPLVQYLKDRKASKGKDGGSSTKGTKHSRAESRESRGDKAGDKKSPGKNAKILSADARKSGKDGRFDKAAKTAIKVLHKEAGAAKSKSSGTSTAASSNATTATSAPSSGPPAERKRERGNASAAAKILQRDLGLGPGSAARRGSTKREAGESPRTRTERPTSSPSKASASSASRQDGPGGPPGSKSGTDAPTESATANNKPGLAQDAADGSGPSSMGDVTTTHALLRKKNNPSSDAPTATPETKALTSAAAASASAGSKERTPNTQKGSKQLGTQAFLKHANASQGITDSSLRAAMAAFGTVHSVSIDKKKGFGYVDFVKPAELQSAVDASPVKVADGQVVVMDAASTVVADEAEDRAGVAARAEAEVAREGTFL